MEITRPTPKCFNSKEDIEEYREMTRLNRIKNPVQWSEHYVADYVPREWVEERNRLIDEAQALGTTTIHMLWAQSRECPSCKQQNIEWRGMICRWCQEEIERQQKRRQKNERKAQAILNRRNNRRK